MAHRTRQDKTGGAPATWRAKGLADQAAAMARGIALLGVSAGLRYALQERRTAKDDKGVQLVREDPESEKKLSSLAVTFPRLTLGGMRGVASTVLWIQAEEDKNDRKWIELETKYDLIGALQPYFSSVYVYHSWNQAYNLSAQWHDTDTKYKWVLDGIAYLYKGEDFNPGNPDIQYEEAQLYAMKLGLAFERLTYRAHWRSDLSRLHELNNKKDVRENDATLALMRVRDFATRRDSRDSPVTAKDDPATKSYFHTEELPDPKEREAGTGWGLRIYPDINPQAGFNLFADRTDGKRPTDPMDFRYGVSPFYFAYIEYSRCLALPKLPTYGGPKVVDAWPAMSLRLWCRDDMYYTGQALKDLFGPSPDKALLASATAFNDKVMEIRDCTRNIQMIAPRAVDLFHAHLARHPENNTIHTKHMRESEYYKEASKAESRLFEALVKWQNNGKKLDDLTGDIRRELREADELYQAAFPVAMKWVDSVYPMAPGDPKNKDREEYENYANELLVRSKGIQAMLTTPAGQMPDMGFLGEGHTLLEK